MRRNTVQLTERTTLDIFKKALKWLILRAVIKGKHWNNWYIKHSF